MIAATAPPPPAAGHPVSRVKYLPQELREAYAKARAKGNPRFDAMDRQDKRLPPKAGDAKLLATPKHKRKRTAPPPQRGTL